MENEVVKFVLNEKFENMDYESIILYLNDYLSFFAEMYTEVPFKMDDVAVLTSMTLIISQCVGLSNELKRRFYNEFECVQECLKCGKNCGENEKCEKYKNILNKECE